MVLGFIEVLTQPAYGVGDFILLFVRQLGIGLAVGLLVGAAAVYVLRRIRLSAAGLYPVASLTVARSPSGVPTRCTGLAFSPCISPGS